MSNTENKPTCNRKTNCTLEVLTDEEIKNINEHPCFSDTDGITDCEREDMNCYVCEKLSGAKAQLTKDQKTVNELTARIAELESERNRLKEHIGRHEDRFWAQVEYDNKCIAELEARVKQAKSEALKEFYQYLVDHRLLCEHCGTVALETCIIDRLKSGNLPKQEE